MVSFKVMLPTPALRDWVDYYWYSRDTSTLSPAHYMVIGDGAPGIIFQIGACSIFINDGMILPKAFLYGQATEPRLNEVKQHFFILGIQLKKEALRALSKEQASALTNTAMSLDHIFTTSQMDRLLNQTTLQALIETFEQLLLQKFNHQRSSDTVITYSTEVIESRIGSIAAPQLYKELNLSERQFQRRFKQQVGVSAETYIRIKKIQKAMQLFQQGTYQKLSDIAYTLNYADQSHFIREFRHFSGFTPGIYERKSKELQFSSEQLPFPVRRIIPC